MTLGLGPGFWKRYRSREGGMRCPPFDFFVLDTSTPRKGSISEDGAGEGRGDRFRRRRKHTPAGKRSSRAASLGNWSRSLVSRSFPNTGRATGVVPLGTLDRLLRFCEFRTIESKSSEETYGHLNIKSGSRRSPARDKTEDKDMQILCKDLWRIL